MWLNAMRRGQELYALEIQRNNHFQPGFGAGLSLGKEAAFDLGSCRVDRILIGEVGREADPGGGRRSSGEGIAWGAKCSGNISE